MTTKKKKTMDAVLAQSKVMRALEAVKAQENMQVLDDLLAAVLEAYRSDPSAPGVLLSKLPNGAHYACIQRYQQKWGEGKLIIAKAIQPTRAEAIKELAAMWLDRRSAEDRLRESVNRVR